jgi:signal transduction histidine kinase
VQSSASRLASAAAGLRRGDLDGPIPEAPEAELAPLAAELDGIRTYLYNQVEEQVRAAGIDELRERALLATLRDPVITTTTDGRIVAFNSAATSMFGPIAESEGRLIQEVISFLPPPSGAARSGDAATGEATAWQGTWVDSRDRALELEVSRTTLAEGHLLGADVYVVHDISRFAELGRLREQLLSHVAYELRAPLAVLDNALDMLGTDTATLSPAEVEHLMRAAGRSTARLHRLLDDLVSAGAIQGGRLVVNAEPMELASAVDGAIAAVQETLGTGAARVECQLPDDLPNVRADRRLVRQVLTNLLVAAARYTPAGEACTVRAEPLNGHVRIGVEDGGQGIPEEQQAQLLGRFYRARGADEEPGIGLGLAIAKGIVEAHGGDVGVEHGLGGRTRTWFTLPAAGQHQPAAEPAAAGV